MALNFKGSDIESYRHKLDDSERENEKRNIEKLIKKKREKE